MTKPQFEIEWRDAGSEPQCAPAPAFPSGIDLDFSDGADVACMVVLPYPAKRIGVYFVTCRRCGLRVACTTAGREDDPRSLRLACKIKYHD